MARPTVYEKWKKSKVLNHKLDLIRGLAAKGLSDRKIAEALHIKDVTLRKMIKDYPDVESAYVNGHTQVGALIRNKRIYMATEDPTVPPELKEKMLRQLEKQYNDYIVEDEVEKENSDKTTIYIDASGKFDPNEETFEDDEELLEDE